MTAKKPTHKKVRGSTPADITNGAGEPAATVTDAQVSDTPEPDTHAEQRLMNIKERDGHAIAVVDVPAHQAEVSLGFSRIEGCAVAAAEAWNSIEKAKDDADFVHSTKLHRQELINHAEEVFTSGVTMAGDTTLARFERKVAEIKARQVKEKEAAKAA